MSLHDRALALAIQSAPDDGPILPFALTTSPGGELVHATIVTANSARARTAGRRIVRGRAAEIAAYAIVVDAFLRVDGVRTDALLVEHATRADATAEVVAHPYHREGARVVLGAPVPYERRPSALAPFDPFTLPWGASRPDRWRQEDNHVAHIVTHAIETDEQIARTARFLRARARMMRENLPASPPPVQAAIVDDRGQRITAAQRAELVRRLDGVMTVHYTSERD